MQKRNRTSKKQNKQSSSSRQVKRNPLHPPARNLTPLMTHVFRFQNPTAASQVAITRGGLLNLMGVGITATTSARIFGAVKLRSIRVWSPISQAFTPELITVEWTGLNAPSSLHSDSSQGLRPAMVHTHPPPDSSADWWCITAQNEAEILMLITCPVATIIDVTVDVRFADNEAAVVFTSAVPIGTVAYGRLDAAGTIQSGVLLASGGVSPF